MHITGNIKFTIAKVSPQEVVGEMPIEAGIVNPFGVTHAGAMLWFADVCATILAFGGTDFTPGASGFPLAINLSAALLGNQKSGALMATSRFVKRGRQVSVVRTVVTGEGGRLIADVTTSHVPSK
jgi:1,4-dihydroxy-2-naphthoyl-CoA hydrolase